jgi:hypothetical protein
MIGLPDTGRAGGLVRLALALTLVVALTACALAQDEGITTTTAATPYVAPDSEEAALAFIACVEEKGFTTARLPDGGVQVQSAPEQVDVFRAVMDKCGLVSMGLSGPAPEPTPEQIEMFYEGLVALSVCLEDQGYDITEPPSLEAFVEGGLGSWDPLGEVLAIHDLSPSRLDTLNEACPQPELYSAPTGEGG